MWLATSMGETLDLWRPDTGKELARFENRPFSTLLAVAPGSVFGWLPDGFYRMPGGLDESSGPGLSERFRPSIPPSLQGQWPLESSGTFATNLTPQRAGVSQDGRVVGVALQGHCYIFDMGAGALRAVSGAQSLMKFVAVSPDGGLVATGGWNNTNVKIWNAADGRLERELPTGHSPNVAFSPEGQWLVTGTGAEYIFWRTADWRQDHRMARPENEGLPGPMCFSSDGKILALAYNRSTVRLISPETGATLAEIDPVPERQLIALAFSADATELAITRTAAPPQIWHLSRIRRRLAEMKLDW
jgi:WD40 repeat protein